jgi:hypothetical protein
LQRSEEDSPCVGDDESSEGLAVRRLESDTPKDLDIWRMLAHLLEARLSVDWRCTFVLTEAPRAHPLSRHRTA